MGTEGSEQGRELGNESEENLKVTDLSEQSIGFEAGSIEEAIAGLETRRETLGQVKVGKVTVSISVQT